MEQSQRIGQIWPAHLLRKRQQRIRILVTSGSKKTHDTADVRSEPAFMKHSLETLLKYDNKPSQTTKEIDDIPNSASGSKGLDLVSEGDFSNPL